MVLPGIMEGVHKLVFWGGRDHVDSSEGIWSSHNHSFLTRETQLLPELLTFPQPLDRIPQSVFSVLCLSEVLRGVREAWCQTFVWDNSGMWGNWSLLFSIISFRTIKKKKESNLTPFHSFILGLFSLLSRRVSPIRLGSWGQLWGCIWRKILEISPQPFYPFKLEKLVRVAR